MITVMKSKIHRATITHSYLNYPGSLSIDKVLMEEAGILNYEQIHVLNINTGDRFITYAIESGEAGKIGLNGAGARLGQVGDKVIIITYKMMKESKAKLYTPKVVYMNEDNESVSYEESF